MSSVQAFVGSTWAPSWRTTTALASFTSLQAAVPSLATCNNLRTGRVNRNEAQVPFHNNRLPSNLKTRPRRICETVSRLSNAQTAQPVSEVAEMKPPYNVLITGSSKGIGLALAREFLAAGDNVVITSRSADKVAEVTAALEEEFGVGRAFGTPSDVADAKAVEALAEYAIAKLGHIDIWINNAGTNAYSYKPLVEANDSDIEEIVRTNTLGVILCCRQAIRSMREQPRGGHIFNMDGAGADGGATPRFAAYGATKRSLAQFTKSMQAELKSLKIKNVVVHNLSPGMVTTELLMSGATTKTAIFFINALAEPPEVVASTLVPLVREVPATCKGESVYIRFLTKIKAYSQILARLLFKARKDKYVQET